jgi:signal transduction histidine kinase
VSDSGQQRKVAVATEALAALDRQADELREHLAKLRQDLVDVQKELGAARANELREANENLVLAVLKADAIAAMAVSNLSQLTRAGAARDSERQDLRRSNEQLVTSALKAQVSAEQAMEAHRQQIHFMGIVAHELRNPLAPIRLAASMLAKGEQPARRSLASLSAIIETEIKHMARLIDDLLEGSRVSTGKLLLELGQVDLQEVIAQAVETCRPLMEARQQRLTLELPAGPVNLRGDHVRLRQIVSNLLDNASKYTGKGGAITLAAVVQELNVTITVSDNGVGIAPEVLPTIFDMFVQDARDSALSSGGLGIGLAVVRELVQAHGGTVSAASAGKNLGSQFVVTLPLAGPAPGAGA